MKFQKNNLIFSPSDLINFLESPYASWMDHFALIEPTITEKIDSDDAMMQLLQKKGYCNEEEILERLSKQELSIVDIGKAENKTQATIDAMHSGADIIYQGYLSKAPFSGFSDFLVKVEGESKLGNYHYEIWDTKLSKTLKPYFTVQLCCYQEMLEEIQGRRSEHIVVVLGDKTQQRLRTDDFYFYYTSLKTAFLELHQNFKADQPLHPADSKSWGRWSTYAESLLKQEDHLSQIATITRSQIKKINADGIYTVQQLIDTDKSKVRKLNDAIFQRLKHQATLQRQSESQKIPAFDVIFTAEQQGFELLPPHSDADVFFDIEGFPLEDGGLEYLWGNTYFDEQGQRQFKDFWAHNAEQEKQAFIEFIDWVYARWQADPSMHIYHYASYEITACKKLMGRYGVREHEVDELLRNQVFVDLYKVVKNSLLIGTPNYSIKSVELLYRGKRDTEVGNGGDSVVVYENWRQNPDGLTWQDSKILKDIRDYNIDDCNSTQELVVWLRAQQQEHHIQYQSKQISSEPEKSEKIEKAQQVVQLRDELLAQAEKADATEANVLEMLAWSLEFHQREQKPMWWKLFEQLGSNPEDLYEDLDCLANCISTEKEAFKPQGARNPVYEYQFDINQDFKLAKDGGNFYLLGEVDENNKACKAKFLLAHSNLEKGLICLQSKNKLPDIVHLIPDSFVNAEPIPTAIQTLAQNYQNNQLEHDVILEVLRRNLPKIKGLSSGEAIVTSQDSTERLDQIIHAISNLQNSYLIIQGPPGSGKTYTAKHVIAELLKQGKRIGISSNSHKAINNLLIGTAQYCIEQKIDADFYCTKNTDDAIEELAIHEIKNNEIINHLGTTCVIGTTAWGFARADLNKQFDYLFIDEAGQVSMANLIAMSQSAHNIVLMGDQMQLGQPTQGTHPAQSGLSTLDYLLGDRATIEENKGIFLATTYRMHSKVNQFISDAIYEGKLKSDANTDRQCIKVPENYNGLLNKEAGLVFIPVEHEGNAQGSDEEVIAIQKAVNELLGRTYTDQTGQSRHITLDDMLFVAPYNLQVTKLKAVLGEQAKVGSVDKFQGQEAPIVFFSMCASDASESPRGMDFLFDKNRLNVAISRAQALAIVVANPKLANSPANQIKQQRLVNVFCYLLKNYI